MLASFGSQWNTFARSQIDTDKIKESALRFESEIGWKRSDIEGKKSSRSWFRCWKVYRCNFQK